MQQLTGRAHSCMLFVPCVQLTEVGVSPQNVTFTNVTMESENSICVRETGAANSVIIVDLANPASPMKRPITADSAIMNPVSKIIALKAASTAGSGDNLQIFNLEAKQKLKSVLIPEQVVFWKWISDTKLGLVTGSAVYHWDMNVSRYRPASPRMLRLCDSLASAMCLKDSRTAETSGACRGSRTAAIPSTCREHRTRPRCLTGPQTWRARRSSITASTRRRSGRCSSASRPAPLRSACPPACALAAAHERSFASKLTPGWHDN